MIMEKCPLCNGFGIIDNYEGERVCDVCKGDGVISVCSENEKSTNAVKLRNKSDEELAKWIAKTCSNAILLSVYEEWRLRYTDEDWWLKYLKNNSQ